MNTQLHSTVTSDLCEFPISFKRGQYQQFVTAASLIINNKHHSSSTCTVTVCTTHNTITRTLHMNCTNLFANSHILHKFATCNSNVITKHFFYKENTEKKGKKKNTSSSSLHNIHQTKNKTKKKNIKNSHTNIYKINTNVRTTNSSYQVKQT